MDESPVIYLGLILQSGSIDLPIPHKDEPPFMKQVSLRDLFDLSTHKVCLASLITEKAVGSYPTFSPLSAKADGIFSVALSVIKPSPG